MNLKTIPLSQIHIGERSRKDLGDLTGLMVSMGKRGLINPVTVDTNNNLICGERRLASAQSLGWEEIDCHIVSSPDELLPLHLEQDENECRLDPSPEEKVRMGKKIEALENPKAKQRQSDAGKTSGRGKPKDSSGSHDPKLSEPVHKSDIAATQVGMSGPTYKRAKKVVSAAEANPDNEVIQAALRQMNETGKVKTAYDKTMSELKRLGQLKRQSSKPRTPKPEKEKTNGAHGLKPHKENTLEDSMRACESIDHAVSELEKMKLDTLKKQDAATLYDGIYALRTRISRITSSLKEHCNGKDDSEKAES